MGVDDDAPFRDVLYVGDGPHDMRILTTTAILEALVSATLVATYDLVRIARSADQMGRRSGRRRHGFRHLRLRFVTGAGGTQSPRYRAGAGI